MLNVSGTRKTAILGLSPSDVVVHQSKVLLESTTNSQHVFQVPIDYKILIGRTSPCDIVLNYDQSVSSQHCEITKKGNLYFLKDLGSTNKTKYNGMVIMSETPILSGGMIEIGRETYKVTIEN